MTKNVSIKKLLLTIEAMNRNNDALSFVIIKKNI